MNLKIEINHLEELTKEDLDLLERHFFDCYLLMKELFWIQIFKDSKSMQDHINQVKKIYESLPTEWVD